jgi:predicted nucleic acid-binding protein
MDQFSLDFDDAYQYVGAEQVDAVIISFDSDFDRTDRRRETPMNILRQQDTAES